MTTHPPPHIQHRPSLPPRPRLLARQIPQARKTLHIMPPQRLPPILYSGRIGHLLTFEVAGLASKDQTSLFGFEEGDDALADLELVVPVEKMDEASGVDDIECTAHCIQRSAFIVFLENVSGKEVRFERVLIAEEIEAQVEEVLLQVAGVEGVGGGAVVDEFADVLGEAAAEVEEAGAVGWGLFEEEEDAGVASLGGDGHFEEAEHADARVGVAGPGFVSLWLRVSMVVRRWRKGGVGVLALTILKIWGTISAGGMLL